MSSTSSWPRSEDDVDPGEHHAVAVDTDVWSNLFASRNVRDHRIPRWRTLLLGRSVVIATQTPAELIAGVLVSNWGRERATGARARIDLTATLPVDDVVVEAFARLTADARRMGHAIAAKINTGDRWVAASAIAFYVPLLSGDKIFRGAPGLRLFDAMGDVDG